MRGQHTPGPWMAAAKPSSIVGWPVVAKDGRSIASVSYLATPGTPFDNKQAQAEEVYRAECEANAHLIAAAPDLLGALLEAHRALRKYEWYDNPKSGWASEPDKHVRHLVDSAIAKATGGAA